MYDDDDDDDGTLCSFVHTLANYLRQAGATVLTLRSGRPFADFLQSKVDSGVVKPDLVVLSPGPGSPDDLKTTISSLLERRLPLFGVCLGLQALVVHTYIQTGDSSNPTNA
jgi:anthranilate synthase